MTVANTVAVLVLLGLAVLGSIYVYKLCTQPHCSCPMCEGDYVVQGTLGYVPLLLGLAALPGLVVAVADTLRVVADAGPVASALCIV